MVLLAFPVTFVKTVFLLTEIQQDAIYQELGRLIREARLKKDVKQDLLAQFLTHSRVSISNIEGGKQKIQLHDLLDLSKYLSMDLAEIIRQLQSMIDDKLSTNQQRKLDSYLGNKQDGNATMNDKENIAGFLNFSKTKRK